jgi:PAS domain S-box-containing protein
MAGLSSPQVAGAWRFRWLAPAAILIVGALALALSSDLPANIRSGLSGAAIVLGCTSVTISCRQRVITNTGRRRRAWFLIAVAGGVAALGNLYLLVVADRNGARSGASLADVALLLALLLGIAGVLNFPIAQRRATDLTRMVLDGVVIGGSILFMISVTIFPQILSGADTGLSSRVLPLLVPVLDVVIATLATLLCLRSGPGDRPGLALGSVGFALFAVSDFTFAVRTAHGGYVLGGPADLGWIAGWAMITLAIVAPDTSENPQIEPLIEAAPVAGTTLTFGSFSSAAVLSLVRSENIGAAASVLWLTVLLAVTTRQILLIIDNERLRRSMELRVIERSNALRTVTQQSDLVVDSVGDGIYGVDSEGLITFVNPAAARVLGYERSQLLGREAHSAFHAIQADGTPYPIENCYVTEAIRNAVITSAEQDFYIRADGLSVPVEVTATPLTIVGPRGQNEIRGAVVVFRDVTQRREVDRLKNEFVSMVSHELRTPLTSIRGSLGLLAGEALGKLSPAATRMAQLALESSDRLTRLIDEILDIERLESGVLTFTLARHSARELIEGAVAHLQVLAASAGVRVDIGAVAGEVNADADRVVQTLVNLVGNAIKFSPRGGLVTVRARERGAYVEFRISDQGRGIPEDKLEAIFGRFEQVDSSDARDKGGFGLGLAISRSLVERLGGRLWAENNPDGGATFRFTLPAPSGVVEQDYLEKASRNAG